MQEHSMQKAMCCRRGNVTGR